MKRRLLSLIIFVVGLYLLINTGRNLWRIWKAQGLVTHEQEKVEQLMAENQQLKERLEEVKKDEFVEQQARDKLNLVKPGETVVIVPEELLQTPEEHFIALPGGNLPNWQQWWLVFKEGK